MDENANSTTAAGKLKRHRGAIGLVAAGVVAGGVLAGTLGASAATTNSTSTATSTTEGAAHTPPAGAKSATPVRSDEKAVSASITATLKQKALAKVPGATAYRVETDAGDAAYEVHMTKADGSAVTVKFDKNLNVTAVETGMGKGDPQMGGGHGPGGMDHDGMGPGGRPESAPGSPEGTTQG